MKHPVNLFSEWMDDAVREQIHEPAEMVLATTSKDGKPSARMILLKEYNEDGFVFYTNYNSRKGEEIMLNPQVALLLYWPEIERQIRIEGRAERISGELSDEYFSTRPVGSQVSAIISPQSQVIPGMDYLEKLKRHYIEHNPGENKRPQNWGGYRVLPEVIEFWQAGPNRLHHRLRYTRDGKAWKTELLAP